MKIQAASFLKSVENVTKIVKQRTEKVKNSKDVSKNVIIEIGSKIYNIRQKQSLLQGDISEKQHISEGLEKITKFLNKNSQQKNLQEVKNGIAKIIVGHNYGNSNHLNDFLLSKINTESINSKEDLDIYFNEISDLHQSLKEEISELSANINELNISESNILSLNILDNSTLSRIIQQLKGNSESSKKIFTSINIDDISKLLD